MVRQHILLNLVAFTLVASADGPSSKPRTIEGWGTTVNAAEDCKFNAVGGQLVIEIPESEKKAYDLNADFGGTKAPRVFAPVKGDFVIQVRVDASSSARSETPGAQKSGYYSGAGLIVFADEKNFVRLERAALYSSEEGARLYTNFEIRVDGKIEKQGNTGDLPPDKDKPVWLRLERKGGEIHGAMSQDGEQWVSLPAKQLRGEAWTHGNIVAGIAAISCGKKTPFSPAYSDFSIR
jgi:regulation of enolase protein 1 (concanavalin A-like superfamily)